MRASVPLFAMLLSGCGLFDHGPTPDADAGSRADGGVAECASLGFEGRCVGTELWYCPATEVVRVDCTLDAPYIQCVEGFPDWGAACAVNEGEGCGFVYADGSDTSYLCTAPQAGCVWSSSGATCTSFVGTCTAADVGSCRASLQIFGCTAGQAAVNDCASWGGACATGRCVDMPEGAPCNSVRAICASGLTCGADNVCARGAGGSASLTLTISDEPSQRDDRLRNNHVHLYASEPYFYVGDRPADIPEPVATADFADWVAPFEGLAPGIYWYDFLWRADTERLAYGVGMVELVAGPNDAVATWRFAPWTGHHDELAYSDPWGVLVLSSDDPILDMTTNPITFEIDYMGSRLDFSSIGGWSPTGRCGEIVPGPDVISDHNVVLVPPGTYSVRASMWYPPDYETKVWHPRSVTVAADECAFVNLGNYDCAGIGC